MRPGRRHQKSYPSIRGSDAVRSRGVPRDGESNQPASVLRLAALAFAQRAFAAAEILARADALILRLPLPDPLRYFAQRNFWAAAIFARAAVLIRRRPPCPLVDADPDPPRSDSSSCSSRCIFSRMTKARLRCWTDMLDNVTAIKLQLGYKTLLVKLSSRHPVLMNSRWNPAGSACHNKYPLVGSHFGIHIVVTCSSLMENGRVNEMSAFRRSSRVPATQGKTGTISSGTK